MLSNEAQRLSLLRSVSRAHHRTRMQRVQLPTWRSCMLARAAASVNRDILGNFGDSAFGNRSRRRPPLGGAPSESAADSPAALRRRHNRLLRNRLCRPHSRPPGAFRASPIPPESSRNPQLLRKTLISPAKNGPSRPLLSLTRTNHHVEWNEGAPFGRPAKALSCLTKTR